MKKSNPLFSIIIPTYNREKFIFETVQSVLNQTHIDFELIIVDNKSTDKTKEIVLSFSDSRINFIQNDKNYERCYSRNVGIKISKGEYILFLDSDDLLENNHLLNWFNTLQDLNFTKGFFICRKKILNLDKILNDLNFKLFNSKRELLINLIQVPVLPGQVCVSKSILSEFQFNKEYLIFEDTALWLQIGNKFSPYFFDFSTFVYRVHDMNSVNWKYSNYGVLKLKSLKLFCKYNSEIVSQLGRKIVNQEFSVTLFNVCKYHIYNKNRGNAIYYCFLSLFYKFSFHQLKHRFLVFFRLILIRTITEYSYK